MAEFFKPNKPSNANAKTRRNALISKYKTDLERFRAIEEERKRLETELTQAYALYNEALTIYRVKPEGVTIPTVEQIRIYMRKHSDARDALARFNFMNPTVRGGNRRNKRKIRKIRKTRKTIKRLTTV